MTRNFLVATLFLCALGAATPADAAPRARVGLVQQQQFVLRIINSDRSRSRLPALQLGVHLSTIALAHTRDMVVDGYFGHQSPNGDSLASRFGRNRTRYLRVAENIGWYSGDTVNDMLLAIENAMLQSPAHRANLLSRQYSRVGIGVMMSGDRVFVTEDFTSQA